jgi:predicted nucleic acid-binding protein
MNVFLDANILVSVINREYPLYNFSARILSLSQHPGFQLFTSPLNLAIAFYFAQKKCSTLKAKEKIELIKTHLKITTINSKMVNQAIQNKSVHDFEDGLQYYSAVESTCNCIVTEDIDDYYFSEIEVISSRDFLMKYLLT